MTARRVLPAVARGRVDAPPSKSYTHRALVAGFLARRVFQVDRPLDSGDTRATASGLSELGARVRRSPGRWTIAPAERRGRLARVRCGASGSTLRFLAAVAALDEAPARFTGVAQLARRPMGPLLEVLEKAGVEVSRPEGEGSLPLGLRGPLHAVRASLDGAVSSQFASALLLTLPTVAGDSQLRLRPPVVSRPYLDATRAIQSRLGVGVDLRGRTFHIPGGQAYRGRRFEVPGDASSAAYLWAAAAATGGRVTVRGIPIGWPQADLAVLGALEQMGARVTRRANEVTVEGRELGAFRVDLTPSPDLYPLLGVLAALVPRPSRLLGAKHVRFKESDRRAATAALARAFGARVRSVPGGLEVEGPRRVRAVRLRDLEDHRLVMSAAVGALAAPAPSLLGDAAAVGKSFPGFWGALARLGAATELAR